VIDLTYFDIARDYEQADGRSGYDGSRLSFGWQATTTLSDALTLVYGADTMTEKARYTNLPDGRADTRISGAFAQAIWAPTDRLDVSASARIDDDSNFGQFETGRLAVAWRPNDRLTLRAAVATGFRAPSIDERFGSYPGTFPFVGNADLTPEESTSYEIGAEQAFGNGGRLSATLFKLDIDNLVTYQFGTPSTLVNLPGASTRQGVEVAADLPVGDRFKLGLAYTYTDATRPDGGRLGLVARHDVTLSLDADLSDRMTAGVTVKHAADRLDDFAAVSLPDYTVVGAQLTYDVTDRAEAYIRVENLFDEDYELASGYATSGRAVYVGLRASF
jgi:vitamin B12 transporter